MSYETVKHILINVIQFSGSCAKFFLKILSVGQNAERILYYEDLLGVIELYKSFSGKLNPIIRPDYIGVTWKLNVNQVGGLKNVNQDQKNRRCQNLRLSF